MDEKTPDDGSNGRPQNWWLLWFVLMVVFTPFFLEFGPFALIILIPAVLAECSVLGIRWTCETKWPGLVKVLLALVIPVLFCGAGWLLMRAFFGGTKVLFF